MTPSDTGKPPSDRYRSGRLWAAALMAVVFASGFTFNAVQGLTAKTDTLWFYLIGQGIEQPTALKAAEAAVHEEMARAPFEPDLKNDFVERETVETNYRLLSTLAYAIRATRGAFPEISAADQRYPEYLSSRIFAAHAGEFVVVALFVGFLILRLHLSTVVAFTLTVAAIALLGVLPAPDPSGNLLLLHGIYAVANAAILIVSPGEGFSPLTVWPRGTIALLMMLVAALRWEGRYAAAYAVFIAAVIVQQNLAMVALLFIVAMDVVLRPEILLRRGVWLSLAGVAAVSLLNMKALAAHDLAFTVVAVVALLLAVASLRVALQAPCLKYAGVMLSRIRTRILRHGPVSSDVIAIVLLWGLSLPVSLGMALMLGHHHWSGIDPAWSNVHSRLLGVYQPVILFGLVMLGLDWIRRAMANDQRRSNTLALTLASLLAGATAFGSAGSVWKRGFQLPQQLRAMDAAIATPRSPDLPPLSHDDRSALLYYALVKQVDTGADVLATLFANRPDLWQKGRADAPIPSSR